MTIETNSELFFYSPATGGFYLQSIHGDNIPPDAVGVSEEQHAALMIGQAEGQRIIAGADGQPVLAAPPPPTAEEIAAQKIAVLEASITPRRLREATLGTDNGWLADVDKQIKALRAGLAA